MSANLKDDKRRREFEQARQAGESCRRAGGKQTSNPYTRQGSLTMLRDEWLAGWIDADQAAKVRR